MQFRDIGIAIEIFLLWFAMTSLWREERERESESVGDYEIIHANLSLVLGEGNVLTMLNNKNTFGERIL
jgi:hypothetical protein